MRILFPSPVALSLLASLALPIAALAHHHDDDDDDDATPTPTPEVIVQFEPTDFTFASPDVVFYTTNILSTDEVVQGLADMRFLLDADSQPGSTLALLTSVPFVRRGQARSETRPYLAQCFSAAGDEYISAGYADLGNLISGAAPAFHRLAHARDAADRKVARNLARGVLQAVEEAKQFPFYSLHDDYSLWGASTTPDYLSIATAFAGNLQQASRNSAARRPLARHTQRFSKPLEITVSYDANGLPTTVRTTDGRGHFSDTPAPKSPAKSHSYSYDYSGGPYSGTTLISGNDFTFVTSLSGGSLVAVQSTPTPTPSPTSSPTP